MADYQMVDKLLEKEANQQPNQKAVILKSVEDTDRLSRVLKPEDVEKAKNIQYESVLSGKPKIEAQASKVLEKVGQKIEQKKEYPLADQERRVELAMQELEDTRNKKMSPGEIFARSLIAIAPALIGKAMAGSIGGAAGGQASMIALQGLEAQRKEDIFSKKQALDTEIERLKLKIAQGNATQDDLRKEKELQLKQKEFELKVKTESEKMQLERQKLQAPEVGKTVSSEMTKQLGQFDSSIEQLKAIEKEIESKADIMGPFMGRLSALPYATETKAFDARMKLAAQKIGVSLEQGKLTDADIIRYRQMLPNITDSPEVAREKIKIVNELIKTEKESAIKALSSAGYNVTAFQAPVSVEKQAAPEQRSVSISLPLQTKEAQAAPLKPDFSKMSNEELMKYLGK